MNTLPNPKPKLIIKANFIGPIMSIDQPLSDNNQNLIFARNGTGKSFISRSLRLLDKVAFSAMDQTKIPASLVSEESHGKGNLHLYEDNNCIGGISLNTETQSVGIEEPKYIFHVFSEDYIDEHVRNKLDNLDGNITHEIIVGRENAELDQKKSEFNEQNKELNKLNEELNKKFDNAKIKHKKKFDIRGNLTEYRVLNLSSLFSKYSFYASKDESSLATINNKFEIFSSFPDVPETPNSIEPYLFSLETEKINKALTTITSESNVLKKYKDKLASDPEFFKIGLEKYQENRDECPFCTQQISDIAELAINQYKKYFDDQEAKEKAIINNLIKEMDRRIHELDNWQRVYLQEDKRFSDLKPYFSLLSDKKMPNPQELIDASKEELKRIKFKLLTKLGQLANTVDIPEITISSKEAKFGALVIEANKLITQLCDLSNNKNKERLSIQKKSCEEFMIDFFKNNQQEIRNIRSTNEKVNTLKNEIDDIQKKYGEKVHARSRVADTFSKLLERLFQDHYSLDKETFKLQRKKQIIRRGGDRTFSDGEKAVLAFCYFIAQTHLRVDSIDDYKRIFFVFDDPVTSMSFDFIYSILQTLKLLRINADGEIEFNLKPIYRPKMLILTHNNHFFNIISTHNIVKKSGLFQLLPGDNAHSLNNQKAIASAHLLQLKHIKEVACNSAKPDHTTLNAIRSVVEGMWRFHRPDLPDLSQFINYLIDELKIEIQSVLINQFSHNTGLDEMLPDEEDIRRAAREAISVVEKIANGQLRII